MIKILNAEVTGICDNEEQLGQYIQSLKELPSKITSIRYNYSLDYNKKYVQFVICYELLNKV